MATEIDRQRRARKAGAGGSALEAAAGAGAVVLAILGLVGVAPITLAQICAIVLGGALLLEGAALSAHYAGARHELDEKGKRGAVGSGVSAEFIAGAGAVVLGVLALVGVQPLTLIPVAAIVLGSGMLFGGGVVAGTKEWSGHYRETRKEHRAGQAAAGAGSAEALVGAGAVVLGILGLVGVGTVLTLSLVAFLALGAGVLMSGTSLAARLDMLAKHDRHDERHHRLGDHTMRET